MSGARAQWFAQLVHQVAACRRCPAMCDRRPVLGPSNGDLRARVLFIGEAPGRRGADRTRIPFSGDQSGRNFARFLASIGLTRERVFVTNAVLCNPHKPSGANRRPSAQEIANCAVFLRQQIEIVDPAVVATLGQVALAALRTIEYHEFSLRTHAGRICHWNGRLLVPLYHPSPQVLISHRTEREQRRDYKAIKRALRLANETD
ncbi:uracil-DNA glycosylase [Pyrinomonas methylaliphatogenes]|nr:uracil-DNA glycosylase [Pyrinomonas methylaliphatogenes]